ncbi:alpha/beta hydrolase [Leptodesmis sp.]|uniref:alpha/beta hydrolase n=1 Tax=Leptodesmis sp. TaxID=3100501 RepID=UPI003D097153
MKRIRKQLLMASAATLAVLSAGGYWYVFIAGAPQLDPLPAEANTGLDFRVETFTSRAMGTERSYGIVLPPGYAQNPARHYPVIVLLHGGHGGARDFQDKAGLTSVLHDLYKSDRLPPSIVVTPDGNDSRGSSPFWDPDYYDGPNGKVSTLIGSELVQVIKSRYRTLHEPQFWAIGGNSSGGWGAFNIGLRYPQQFRILFSHTGYFVDNSGPENSPLLFVHTIPNKQRSQLRAYLDAGDEDAKYLQATKKFHQTLSQLGVANDFRIYPGGHGIVGQNVGWNYWHKHLFDSLSYVGTQFKVSLQQSPTDRRSPEQKSPKPMQQQHKPSHQG